jgi:hypothetical protein
MSARFPLMMGIMTTVMFVGVGTLLVVEQRTNLGLLVIGLGVIRGLLTVRQARSG